MAVVDQVSPLEFDIVLAWFEGRVHELLGPSRTKIDQGFCREVDGCLWNWRSFAASRMAIPGRSSCLHNDKNMAPSGFARVFVGWFDGETYFISHVFTCVGWSSIQIFLKNPKDLSWTCWTYRYLRRVPYVPRLACTLTGCWAGITMITTDGFWWFDLMVKSSKQICDSTALASCHGKPSEYQVHIHFLWRLSVGIPALSAILT